MQKDSYEYWINEIMWKEKTRFSRMAESVSYMNYQIDEKLPSDWFSAIGSTYQQHFVKPLLWFKIITLFFSWHFIKSKKRKFKKLCTVYNKLDQFCTQDSDLERFLLSNGVFQKCRPPGPDLKVSESSLLPTVSNKK